MFQRGLLLFGLILATGFTGVAQTTPSEDVDGHSDYVYTFQFSPDSKTMVGKADSGLFWWDLSSRKLLRSLQVKTKDATLEAQGRLLSLVGDEGGIRVMDVVTNQEVKFLEGAESGKVEFSADGKTVAFAEGNQHNPIKLWDVTTGKAKVSIERLNLDEFLGTMLFSPDGTMLAALSRSITLWSVSTGKEVRSIKINAGLARVAFTPDGKMICISGFDNMGPSFIKCFGVSTGRQTLSVTADATSPFAFSPDGKVLALIRPGEGITLIDMTTGREAGKITVAVRDEHAFTQMSFSPDGKLLAAASPDGLVLIDPRARKQLFILTEGSVKRKESDPQ